MSAFTRATYGGLALLAGLGVQSCQSSLDRIDDYEAGPAVVRDEISEVTAPEGFDFATTRGVEFDLRAVRPATAVGVANVALELYAEGADSLLLLASGFTDADGRWAPSLSVAADHDSLTLRVNSVGYPAEHRVAVAAGRTVGYTLGADNANGRVVAEVTPADEPQVDTNGVAGPIGDGLASRAAMSYLGGYDAQGVPDYLTTPGDIWPDVLDFIAVNLPERPGVPTGNPHYLDKKMEGSVFFRDAGELWLSFAHEGAGYRNAVGYFLYDPAKPPKRKSDVDVHTVAFPNTSFRGSGGGLQVADRVFIGEIPANTAVGWFLIPNGWNGGTQTVNDRWNTRYTVDDLNTFTRKAYRKHAVLLANPVREFLVLGFEDLNRPGGDNDFNDAVFIVEPRPWSAVDISRTPAVKMPGDDLDGDGVTNDLDLYPADPERAFELYAPAKGKYGTLAYEDMWPRTGDYDFNDLVVDYSVTEVLSSTNEIKDVKLKLRVRAIGASQNHGFAVQLPVDPALVEVVAGQVIRDDYVGLAANGTEAGMATAVVPAFTDGFDLFGERFGIINTDPDKPELTPGELEVVITFAGGVYRDDLGYPPYDPFMLRSQTRGREIHLAGHAPTAKADPSYFNTHADDSDAAGGHYYVSENNLPWVLHVPDALIYPQERVAIDDVYVNFADWATYGGESNASWYRNSGANVDGGGAY